jgi:hypothetical protein
MNLIVFRRIDIIHSNIKSEYNLLKFRFFSMDKVSIDLLDKIDTTFVLNKTNKKKGKL